MNNKIIALILIMFLSWFLPITAGTSENNKNEDGVIATVYESETKENNDHNAVIPSATVPETTVPETIEPEKIEEYSRELTYEDKYLLAKIAMAEAEGESLETKILVILTVLNRVEANGFPNTIEGVIFEKTGNTYQFSPVMTGGRWWTTEPNEECWEAVGIVNATEYDISEGALFFESCSGESWHSRNLTLICELDGMRFYK